MLQTDRMRDLAQQYEIKLQQAQLEKIQKYSALLLDWNSRMNLTAITDPQEMESKHFLDCLLLGALPQVQGKLVDVGSGAGFPGMVAKILKPQLDVTLMEPNGKRAAFLQALSSALALPVDVVRERGEEAARKPWRESFDVATARAVAALPELCEVCLPLVRVGGWFLAMKGDAAQEVAAARTACAKLGGKYVETQSFVLPDGSARSLVLIQKTEPTPSQYPRNGGVIAKRPL